jgi:hypothetical protein
MQRSQDLEFRRVTWWEEEHAAPCVIIMAVCAGHQQTWDISSLSLPQEIKKKNKKCADASVGVGAAAEPNEYARGRANETFIF